MSGTLTVVHQLVLPTTPSAPMSENQARGEHWKTVRKRLDPWKDAVSWIAKTQRRKVHAVIAEHGLPLVIRVTIPFLVERRRDPHNYVSTVVKAIIDGLVVARWVPDDTSTFVTVVDPVLVVGGLPKIEVLA